nr:hypothetical protein [Candidatus Sigynarchaeota archaeon]
MIPDWFVPVVDWFNQFVTFYQAQTLSVQVLLIVLIVLGFVAAGFVVYGALWLAYQIIKISIIGSILLVYLIVISIASLFLLAIDARKIEGIWNKAGENTRCFMNKAYPSKNKATAPAMAPKVVAAAIAQTAPQRIIIHVNDTASSQAVTEATPKQEVATAREVPPEIEIPAGPAATSERKYFCTACGTPFSSKMNTVLGQRSTCFCEHCGQKFTGYGSNPVPA